MHDAQTEARFSHKSCRPVAEVFYQRCVQAVYVSIRVAYALHLR